MVGTCWHFWSSCLFIRKRTKQWLHERQPSQISSWVFCTFPNNLVNYGCPLIAAWTLHHSHGRPRGGSSAPHALATSGNLSGVGKGSMRRHETRSQNRVDPLFGSCEWLGFGCDRSGRLICGLFVNHHRWTRLSLAPPARRRDSMWLCR